MNSADLAHSPVPPTVPPAHPDQRYFHGRDGTRHVDAEKYTASALVYRNGGKDLAEITVSVRTARSGVQVDLELNPDQLRELAQRLLDAAHDIDAHPAEVLKKASQTSGAA